MICRYAVECPGCQAIIVLRVGVGIDKEQPFCFVCSRCRAPIRAKQLIWYEPKPGVRLELEEGKEVPIPEKPDQVITIHPDFPAFSNATAMTDPGGSPFVMQHILLGDRFEEFIKRLQIFRSIGANDWADLRRWMVYYLDGNWADFDRIGQHIFGDSWPNPRVEWHRHDLIHTIFDSVFMPLLTEPVYPEMKQEWYESWSLNISAAQNIKDYAKEVVASGEIKDLQRDLFHCIELYLLNRSSLLPALPAEMYHKEAKSAITESRLFRDDFPALRDLYISTYESCHHTLTFALAMVNISKRGNAGDFGEKCRTIKEFRKLPSTKKVDYLTALPVWARNWPILLDRSLRNAIGHHSARHDLRTGLLHLRQTDPIPYLQFVMKTLRLINAVLACLTVVKMYYIIVSMHGSNTIGLEGRSVI